MKLYTEETIPYTQEYFIEKTPKAQNVFIWIITFLIVIIFIFISIAKFDEVIKVTGFIRPKENISNVSNAVTGRIKSISYKTGDYVVQGQLLLEIDPTQLEAEKASLLSKIEEENKKLDSLYQIQKSIITNKNLIDKQFREASLRYELWKVNLSKLKNIKDLKYKKYQQEKKLPSSMTTSIRIYELESDYLISCNEYTNFDLSFKHDIEYEIINLETSLKINNSKLIQIEDSLRFTKIIAPIDGYIQEISTYNINDWIQAGQKIFNIIPKEDNKTKIELYVSAKQIGKIEKGMNVKMRFPSLPYHEFGGAEGKIITIDPDSTRNENSEAYFIIKTDINQQSLFDKKGKEYPLKVGLQVDARIIISTKTILNFMLEKLNLWY